MSKQSWKAMKLQELDQEIAILQAVKARLLADTPQTPPVKKASRPRVVKASEPKAS